MFIDKLIPKRFLLKKEVCSIEVVFKESEKIIFLTHLKQIGNKVEIVRTEVLSQLKLPAKIVTNKIPTILILNGAGVITKKSSSNETEFVKIVNESLPAIKNEDFYIQLFKQEDNLHFISFCRKELLDELMKELNHEKVDLINVYLGPSIVIGMDSVADNFNRIPTTLHDVEFTNGHVSEFFPIGEQNSIVISDLLIEKSNVLGFAAGLSYFLENIFVFNSDKVLEHLYLRHIESNKFKFSVLVCFGIALFVSLINVVFYTNYFDRNNKLEAELSVYESKNTRINSLLEDYQKKKGLIEGAGILEINHLSEYADRIASTVPEEVILTNLNFNPKLEREDASDSLVTFNAKELIVQGNCNKSLVLNDWINILKLQKFIKEVNLEKFTYSKESFLPNFEIEIKMN